MEIEYKPEEEMRICKRTGCGNILLKRQKYFCSKECMGRTMRPRGKEKPPETFPKWKCLDCGAEYQLDYDPRKEKNRFNNLTTEHQCDTMNT